jgi:hypothetical protein
MPSPPNITNITPPRVPLIDERTGLISREWYRFFLNLFNLTGGGSNTASLTDLQLGPPAPQQENLVDIIIDVEATKIQPTEESANEQIAELAKQVEGLEVTPIPALGTFAALQQDNLPWTTFDTTPQSVPTTVGTLAWGSNSTLGLQATANVIYQLGESEYVYARASATITKGQLCYHTGAVGSSGVITVAPTPLALTDPNQIVGVAAESIALNGFGLIQISGTLRGFNTTGSSVGETWADGDPLYYNPSFVGSFTKNKPSAPNQKSYIGEVINAGSGGSGSIHIRIVPGSVLGGTDSNVQFGALANGDLIQYDSVLGYWKNVPASTLPVGTATNIAGGAAGSVPYQSAPGTTTFLGIGTALQVLKVNAGATAPEWVSGAALTKTDDTNVTLTLGGSPSTALLAATSLTLGWTGQLAVTRGGTGLATVAQGDLLYGSAANTLVALPKNTTATRYLANTGTSNNPAWAQVDLTNGVTGTLPTGNGGTGLTSFTTNGVLYASSTSALATSSNLQFNGTNLGIGGAATISGIEIIRATGSATPTPVELRLATTTSASDWSTTSPWGRISFYSADASSGGAKVQAAIQTVAAGTTGGTSSFDFLVQDNINATLFKTMSFQPAGTNTTQTIFYSGGGVERIRINSAGYTQFNSNLVMPYQGAPTSKAAAATLTGAELITGILNTTGTTYTITLPTGTNIEGALTWSANDVALDWWVINTATGTITIGANGNTTLGGLTIATGVSAHFRIRRTAANTFTIYRLS